MAARQLQGLGHVAAELFYHCGGVLHAAHVAAELFQLFAHGATAGRRFVAAALTASQFEGHGVVYRLDAAGALTAALIVQTPDPPATTVCHAIRVGQTDASGQGAVSLP